MMKPYRWISLLPCTHMGVDYDDRKRSDGMIAFDLDSSSSIPLWIQMKNRFIYLITSGYYRTGDQLPTVRALAAEIEVNYNTVSKVYKSLEADGYIESKHRQGAFVCDVSGKPGVSVETLAENVTRDYFKRCQTLGMSLNDIAVQFDSVMREARGEDGGHDSYGQEGKRGEREGDFIRLQDIDKTTGRRSS